MLPIEEVKKRLIENRTDKDGDLDLSGLDLSDFGGNVLASRWKVKKSLDQGHNEVGGDLFQDGQSVQGSILYDYDSLHNDFKAMSPAEKGEFIAMVFCGYGEDTIRIEDVDLSPYCSNVEINRWTINGNLSQCCHKVGGDLFQHHQEAGGSLFQNNQKVGCNLYQDGQEAGGGIAQDKQEAADEREREDESMCIAPDYEGECERLRKELVKANRKNEVLLWALDKAMEEAGK